MKWFEFWAPDKPCAAALRECIAHDRTLYLQKRAKAQSLGLTIHQYAIVCAKGKPKCAECGRTHLQFLKGVKGPAVCCSMACGVKYRAKTYRANMLAKHGVENASQLDTVKQKKTDTCMKNFGVAHPQQSAKVRKRSVKAVRLRYGVDNVSQATEVQATRVATFQRNWGHDNPMHDPELRKRVARASAAGNGRRRSIELDGKIFNYMGYESRAIKDIHEFLHVPVSRIKTSTRAIPYTLCGKSHVYIPDLEVVKNKQRWIIEVKSTWTLGLTRKTVWRAVRAKALATQEQFDYALLVYLENRKLVVLSQTDFDLTWSQLKRKFKQHGVDR